MNAQEVAALYEKHGHALYRRALSLLGDQEEAHELVQETFLQFWRGRARFMFRASPFTFLYRVTTNLAMDRLRQRYRRPAAAPLEESKVSNGAAEDGVATVAELAHLTEGLEGDVLMIAVLWHVDCCTQEEIAATLGISRRTVGKRLRKFEAHTAHRKAMLERERQ